MYVSHTYDDVHIFVHGIRDKRNSKEWRLMFLCQHISFIKGFLPWYLYEALCNAQFEWHQLHESNYDMDFCACCNQFLKLLQRQLGKKQESVESNIYDYILAQIVIPHKHEYSV